MVWKCPDRVDFYGQSELEMFSILIISIKKDLKIDREKKFNL